MTKKKRKEAAPLSEERTEQSLTKPKLPAAGSFGAWVMASRPRTLPVAVAPVAVGAAIAFAMGAVRWAPLAAALFAALLIQIGTNFANDVFDFEKGADNEQRVGPPRAVQSGLLTPRTVRKGMIVAFGLALLLGAYVAYAVGPVIVAVGIVSILSGIAYTGGPFPLAYNGLGDVFVFLFFGFVAVVGSTFVANGTFPYVAFLAAIPVGALATAVLVVNNVRDHETDRKVNKKTLVVRFGRGFGVAEYALLLLAAFIAPAVMAATKISSPWVLLCFATLPRGARILSTVATKTDGAVLTGSLADTAKLLLAHALFLAIGIVIPKVALITG